STSTSAASAASAWSTTPTTSSRTNGSARTPSLTEDRLRDLLARRRGALKSALMDQELVAGIGNIYSDEILSRPGRIRPGRPPVSTGPNCGGCTAGSGASSRSRSTAGPTPHICREPGCSGAGRTGRVALEATAASGDCDRPAAARTTARPASRHAMPPGRTRRDDDDGTNPEVRTERAARQEPDDLDRRPGTAGLRPRLPGADGRVGPP